MLTSQFDRRKLRLIEVNNLPVLRDCKWGVEGDSLCFHESSEHALLRELKVWDYWEHVGFTGRHWKIGKEKRV